MNYFVVRPSIMGLLLFGLASQVRVLYKGVLNFLSSNVYLFFYMDWSIHKYSINYFSLPIKKNEI